MLGQFYDSFCDGDVLEILTSLSGNKIATLSKCDRPKLFYALQTHIWGTLQQRSKFCWFSVLRSRRLESTVTIIFFLGSNEDPKSFSFIPEVKWTSCAFMLVKLCSCDIFYRSWTSVFNPIKTISFRIPPEGCKMLDQWRLLSCTHGAYN